MVDSQFAEECLKHHNTFRSLHNSPELVIDIKLNDFAQDWALSLASKDILEHRQENDYGENLYVGYSSDPEWKLEAQVPVQSWYDEISAYKFGQPTPENVSAVGHFTQLVWKGSEKLGVGKAQSANGRVYVVCNYEPAGNVAGEFAKNVTPAQKDDESVTGGSGITEQRSVSQRTTTTTATASPATTATATATMVVASNTLTTEDGPRLDAIPAEELRVWSAWLTKVAETAVCEWHEWLLPHINLALRLNERLLEARERIELEKLQQQRILEESTVSGAAVAKVEKTDSVLEKSDAVMDDVASDDVEDKEESEIQQQPSSDVIERVTEPEIEEQKEAEDVTVSIGTAPAVEEQEEAEQVKIIPLPKDECEMQQFIKEFRKQAKRYQLLYERWIGNAEKVIEEIVGKSEQVYTHEEIPYFFYLREEKEEEADVDIGIESDGEDEEILRLDAAGRERITCNDLHLFFNLADESDEIESSSYGNLVEQTEEDQRINCESRSC